MKWSYQTEYIACGEKCPACPHGPFWYRYRDEEGKRVREYVGVFHPLHDVLVATDKMPKYDPRKEILDRRTANRPIAYDILGLKPSPTAEQAKRAFETLASFCRLDLDNLHEELALITCAYSYLRVCNDWR